MGDGHDELQMDIQSELDPGAARRQITNRRGRGQRLPWRHRRGLVCGGGDGYSLDRHDGFEYVCFHNVRVPPDGALTQPIMISNRRCASPLEAGRPFGLAVHAPPSLSAAVADLGRWATQPPALVHSS